ncbi:hypothetical protein ACFWN1_05875 [Streptomyces sp. NPDC058459]|uniref:hypothetical protein n=1 Tax=Streptomyces sp. NPDC058459 TaxID=3346508 RepID=UPI0036631DB0
MTLWQPGMTITASRMQDATPWVPLTSVGAYQGGASDGPAQPMVRDSYVRDELVREFKGIINFSGVTTAAYTFFTFSTAYQQAYERNWAAAGFGQTGTFRVYLSTAGNWAITGQAGSVTSIRLDGFEIKSATGTLPAS